MRTAGVGVEALVGEDLRRRDGEREGRERQIEAAEPERRKAEQKAGAEADEAGEGNRGPVGHTEFRRENRRPVAANGEEGAVAERNLAVEAGEQIEAEERDGEDQHLRTLVEMVARRKERKGEPACEDRERHDEPHVGHRQTLATRRRPNRPEGRQTSTPTMIASATESFTSAPTT